MQYALNGVIIPYSVRYVCIVSFSAFRKNTLAGVPDYIDMYQVLMIFEPFCIPFYGLSNDKKIIEIRHKSIGSVKNINRHSVASPFRSMALSGIY